MILNDGDNELMIISQCKTQQLSYYQLKYVWENALRLNYDVTLPTSAPLFSTDDNFNSIPFNSICVIR